MTLAERIRELEAQHGSLRAAARVLDIDPGYLSRLLHGEKTDPGDLLLRRMGLRAPNPKQYERINSKEPT
jgi:hypothetical protein